MKRLILACLMCVSTSVYADYADYKTCSTLAKGISAGRVLVKSGEKTEEDAQRVLHLNKDDLAGKISLNMWISTENSSFTTRQDYHIAAMERCLKLMRYMTVYGPNHSEFLYELNYPIKDR
jgi:hypothetical protein